ncbi:MAG TPA: M1 family metallopeptidase [Steroidobacteraceae bacterium]|nr:M1 family metallopeptidase [Steroidobacteraceae bacterium]
MTRRPVALLLLFAGFAAAPGYAGTDAGSDRIVLPDTVVPTHYDLEVTPDAAAATFTAVVRIVLEVKRATPDIAFNAADLTFSHVSLSGYAAVPSVSFDAPRQTAILHFPTALTPGQHVLTIRYSGRINSSGDGLFYIDYDDSHGRGRALYTQFENSYARQFFPCWDEPNRKATITLTVTAPAADMAVSNMPIARTVKLAGGLARTTFQTTPRMSSYLLFLGVGDFERITRRVRGVLVGVVFKRGDATRARFALDTAAQVLAYCEDYFAIRYPLPKLDIISGPGRSQEFGAMENWGAIFGFDHYFLLDQGTATPDDELTTYSYVAHEIAHQWVGDLVTMDWWNDLWLNEGLAEWMQYKVTDHFHPEWDAWLTAQDEREQALQLDARAGTHPVITPIANVLQADNAFDSITYGKGMSVVRMLERLMGERAFRTGLRRYLRDHAYRNAVSEDLWRELDRSASMPISRIAHEFTLQAGVPVIRVTGAHGLRLDQGRFAADGSVTRTLWQVPVVVQFPGGKAWQGIVSSAMPVELTQLSAAGALVNAGQSGYFRTQYAPDLIGPLSQRFHSLSPPDQMGLLLDAKALGLAGYEPLPDLLQLVRQVDSGVQPQIRSAVADTLGAIARFYHGLAGEPKFKAYARTVLNRMLANVGWKPLPGENAEIAPLRVSLIQELGELDDEAVTKHARELFAQERRDAVSFGSERHDPVLAVVAAHADPMVWAQIHMLAKAADNARAKDTLYELLASAHDGELARQTLQLTLGDEIAPTSRPAVLNAVAANHPELAFDFAVLHRDQVNSWLEPNSHDLYAAHLLARSADPAARDRLMTYIDAHVPAADRGPAEAVEALINYHIKLRAQQLPQIDAWLQRAH